MEADGRESFYESSSVFVFTRENGRESTRGKAVREATRQRKIAEREAEVAVDMPVVSAAVNTKII